MRVLARLLFSLFALVAAAGVPAQAVGLRATYGVSIAGIPLGSATVTLDAEPAKYKLDLLVRLSNVLRLGRGAGGSTGFLGNGRILPESYAMTWATSKSQTTRMALASGAVRQVEITPPYPEFPDRIPVAEDQRKAVLDPISALIMPAPAKGEAISREACDRVLPVYDGLARFDLTLRYERVETVETAKGGYGGPAVVCSVRYKAVAGHRPNRKSVMFMESNEEIAVWLVPLEGTKLMVPWRISVLTMIGTAEIQALRYESLPPQRVDVQPLTGSVRAR